MKLILRVLTLLFILLIAGCGMRAEPKDDNMPTEGPNQRGETPHVTAEPEATIDPIETDEADDLDDELKELLDSMTLDEKLGQLLLVGYPDSEDAASLIQKHMVGGIVLFSRNTNSFDQLYDLTVELKELNKDNKLPLFIAMDEEGGVVSRLPHGKTPVPNAQKVGLYDDIDMTKNTGTIIGRELAATGVNTDFAPVLDIVQGTDNELLFNRSYGSTVDIVTRHGQAFIQGLDEAGIISCAKHFPGHGDTVVDSHMGMPVIDKSYEQWLAHDAVPFQAAIDNGVDMVMVGHLAYPQIDSTGLPASRSKVIMTDILRKQMGYEGLIITDDIEMLGYPQEEDMAEAVVDSFKAGVDIFAIGHTLKTQLNVLDALKKAVKGGVISEQRIDESVLRIARLKEKIKKMPRYSLQEAKDIFGSQKHYDAILNLVE